MLARTLIADRSGDLRVRLLSLNEHPERLPVGLALGELERVLVLESSSEERGTASEPNHVQPLLETVDSSVPVVSDNGLKLDPAKIVAIATWPEPQNLKEAAPLLGSVLRIASSYRTSRR